MAIQTEKKQDIPTAKRLITRFVHLLSALGVEGILSVLFFIYLAWLDASAYGELMYAMAAGSVVLVGIRFGLYYQLVADLSKAGEKDVPKIINRVNIIKLALLVPSMIGVYGLAAFRGFSPQMAWILFFVSLGYALEAMAETFFADFRVRGRQDLEARIKIVSIVISYGYGFLSIAMGFSPVYIGLFVLISGVIRLGYGSAVFIKAYSVKIFVMPEWPAVWTVFRAALVFAMIDNLGNLYNKTNIFFLEKVAGVKGVASYSATWNLVDPIAKLASEQFLGWVIFPVLSILWWKNRERVGHLVRTNALWLIAIAFPVMFLLYTESNLIISMIYPEEYRDAIWMQKYLVWTIPFTFEGNLFSYVMMVSGAAKTLLVFSLITTIFNLLYNITLVQPFGLAGACLVIILSKLTMTLLTFSYCQMRFNLFKVRDLVFPFCTAGISLGLFFMIRPIITLQPAVAVTLGLYFFVLWKMGKRFLGGLPGQGELS